MLLPSSRQTASPSFLQDAGTISHYPLRMAKVNENSTTATITPAPIALAWLEMTRRACRKKLSRQRLDFSSSRSEIIAIWAGGIGGRPASHLRNFNLAVIRLLVLIFD